MAKLTPFPESQAFDENGDPLSGGKVYTYEAGTSTNKTTYTDASEDTANANPVILDSEGRGAIWLGEGSYKIRVFDSSDNLIDERDDIIGDSSAAFLGSTFTISGNTTITAAYRNALISVTAAATLSLLAASEAGEGFSFAVANDGAGAVTVDPNLTETVNGETTVILQPGDSATFASNGTDWLMIGGISAEDITFAGNNTFSGSVTFSDKAAFTDDGELTISSGVITVTGANHTVDTESDAASDDLDTINGGSDGQILILRTEDDARDVVLKHNTGNIFLAGLANVTLGNSSDQIVLKYDGAKSKWLQMSATPSQGAKADTALQPGYRQVLQSVKTDAEELVSFDAWTDITDISVAITPGAATSRVRVTASLYVGKAAQSLTFFRLVRDSTAIAVGDAAGSRIQATAATNPSAGANDIQSISIDFIDSPATTSEVTYKVQYYTDTNNGFYINRTATDTSSAAYVRTVSTITVEEILA